MRREYAPRRHLVSALKLSLLLKWLTEAKAILREVYSWSCAVKGNPLSNPSPNLLPLDGFCLNFIDNDKCPALVSPWCEDGNLLEFISKKAHKTDLRLKLTLVSLCWFLHCAVAYFIPASPSCAGSGVPCVIVERSAISTTNTKQKNSSSPHSVSEPGCPRRSQSRGYPTLQSPAASLICYYRRRTW